MPDPMPDPMPDATPQPSATQRQPILLLRNQRYPTYQLYATAGNGKAPPDDVLKIAILETLNWLRQRFRAFDLPKELDWPDAAHYTEVNSNDFKTFLLNEGYKVEVVWLPDDKIWTLQLTEPDLGPQPGTEHQSRLPVPGRLYETNIAYHLLGEQVICGFRTIVAEPEGTNEVSEVYRLAVIKKLARNPLVGLKQEWPITDDPITLDTVGAIRRLDKWLRDDTRMLPAVIATACAKKELDISQLPSLEEFISNNTKAAPFYNLTTLPQSQAQQTAKNDNPYGIDLTEIARAQMGYALFFCLPEAQFEAFQRITRLQVTPGEIIVSEPNAFDGEIHHFASATPPSKLTQLISNYPKNKTMQFGLAIFLAEARLRYQNLLVSISQSKEEAVHAMHQAEAAKNQLHQNIIAELREEIRLREEKIRRLNEKISNLEDAIQGHHNELRDVEHRHQVDLERKEQEIRHLQSLLNRPKLPVEVSNWVTENFEGRMIFHERARSLMSNVAPNEVDLPLLCDALEYLAVEYRDSLLGLIDEVERNQCCSQKYDRPFTVTPIDEATIEHHANAYKIKYKIGQAGKPVETPLNLHLKIGNTNENLLRIYFLYDKDKKLIVVGSLPWHLKTENYH